MKWYWLAGDKAYITSSLHHLITSPANEQRIDHLHPRALLEDEQRVDVHLRDLSLQVAREPRQAHDACYERVDIGPLRAAHALQQLVALELAQHTGGLVRRHRCNAIGDVAEHFDMDAAQPGGDNRSEHRVANDAQHYLDPAADHL